MTYDNSQVKNAQVLSEDHNIVLDISNNFSIGDKNIVARTAIPGLSLSLKKTS
jgi:hypothetical protein